MSSIKFSIVKIVDILFATFSIEKSCNIQKPPTSSIIHAQVAQVLDVRQRKLIFNPNNKVDR